MTGKNDRPKVCIGVVVLNEKNQFLMLKRAGKYANGQYGTPAGKLEFGETFEAAAAREVMEEVGVKIKNIKYVDVTNYIHQTERNHTIFILMAAQMEPGEVPKNNEPEKHSDMVWADDFLHLPSPIVGEVDIHLRQRQLEQYLKEVKGVLS